MLITFDKINIRKEEVLVTNVQNINFPETNTQKFAQSCLRLIKTHMRKLRIQKTSGYQSQRTNQMMRTVTERRTLSTVQMKRMEKMLLMDLHNLTLRIVLNM